ncbi:non-hydrolyzing UDP-N-acetylglucosamine 2-epimerase [Butyrivibrio sp. XBB1001]|uniref:non-hydrolyzing UDP-N-acetylglucosamine 2-epimerase n=1 Tax=Butyrivibrio sp. XBB1001 TaxID=1280682 RepID=UPI00047DC551|nr:UDP-N-acetylglucosamine 2-epimerase (non-hydrolyzing) [Butyrivibrio sp. XBB1001]
MEKVLVVFGTRPEAIKMCPLVNKLKQSGFFKVVVCVSGQHREMLDQVLEIFDVIPDIDLDIMKEKQSLFQITTNVLNKIETVLDRERPKFVIVHGDTTTAYATALACFYKRIRVVHVEAGLRTYNSFNPYPEEFNRQSIDSISDILFAPTEEAQNNLIKEGKQAENIYITGNTGIDAFKYTLKEDYANEITDWIGDSKLILFTMHRRENLGKSLESAFGALRSIVSNRSEIKIVYPVHRNPQIIAFAEECFNDVRNIKLVDPLSVVDFHNLMSRAYLIMTDSGGVQEEATFLGIPTLVLRDFTERPEGVKAGTLKVVGTDNIQVEKAVYNLLDNDDDYQFMRKRSTVYGNGNAGEMIVDILRKRMVEE